MQRFASGMKMLHMIWFHSCKILHVILSHRIIAHAPLQVYTKCVLSNIYILESSEENAEIICEHFVKDISCTNGQTIKVVYANYGRTSEIPCQGKRKYIMKDCRSKDSLAMAKNLCEGKTSCHIKALNSIWGNTCPGVIKYMDIRFQCVGKIVEPNGNSLYGGTYLWTHFSSQDIILFLTFS